MTVGELKNEIFNSNIDDDCQVFLAGTEYPLEWVDVVDRNDGDFCLKLGFDWSDEETSLD